MCVCIPSKNTIPIYLILFQGLKLDYIFPEPEMATTSRNFVDQVAARASASARYSRGKVLAVSCPVWSLISHISFMLFTKQKI